MKLIQFLSFFDLFSIPMSLNYSKQARRHSVMGIFLSFLIFLFLLYLFINSDLFTKSKPIVVRQSIEEVHSPAIIFNPNQYISIFISDSLGQNQQDPAIFTVSLTSFERTTTSEGISNMSFIEENLVSCTKEIFSQNSANKLNNGYRKAYCLANKTLELSGSISEIEHKYFMVNLMACNNKTYNNNCKSPEEISDFFTSQQMFFGVGFPNSAIDITNYENPTRFDYYNEIQMIDPKISKRMYIYLKKYLITTDKGLIFSDNYNESAFGFEKTVNDFALKSSESQPIFQSLFLSSKNIDSISRRYEKLPEVLAQLIGMMNVIKIFCFVLVYYKIHFETMKKILSKLYTFRNSETMKTTKRKRTSLSLDLITHQKIAPLNKKLQKKHKIMKVNTKEHPPVENFLSKVLKPFGKFFRPSEKSLSEGEFQKESFESKIALGYSQFLLNKFKSLFSSGNKNLNLAEELYAKEIDILRIVKKLHELEKLKFVLFDKEQLILFNSIDKTLLNLNDNKGFSWKKDLKEVNMKKEEAIVKISEKIGEGYDINRRLLNLLNK